MSIEDKIKNAKSLTWITDGIPKWKVKLIVWWTKMKMKINAMKGKQMKRLFLIVGLLSVMLCGCRESDMVSWNVSKEADYFNVLRRITVFNIRTDTVLLQMTGKFALKNNASNELCVIAEIEKGVYQKHFVYLNEYTMYTVEDLSGTEVSPYAYELEFLPQQLSPVQITVNELKEDLFGKD